MPAIIAYLNIARPELDRLQIHYRRPARKVEGRKLHACAPARARARRRNTSKLAPLFPVRSEIEKMVNQINPPAPDATSDAREAEAARLCTQPAPVLPFAADAGCSDRADRHDQLLLVARLFGGSCGSSSAVCNRNRLSGINLLLRGRVLGSAWEERKVRQYLDRGPQ